MLAMFLVDTDIDELVTGPDGTFSGSLRQMIENANQSSTEDDTITFAAGLFDAAGNAAINLTQATSSVSGLLITDEVVIDAGAGSSLTIDASGLTNRRVLEIAGTASGGVTLRNLTITGGNLTTVDTFGAGIRADAPVTLDTVAVTDNHAAGGLGGGMYAFEVDISNSSFTFNSAGGDNPGPDEVSVAGGGLYLDMLAGEQASIRTSTFSNNTATPNNPMTAASGEGGGLAISALGEVQVLVEDVVVEQNTAYAEGGGIWIDAEAAHGSNGLIAIRNSIIRDNQAIGTDPTGAGINSGDGGGVYVTTRDSSVLLDGLSVTGNRGGENEVGGGEESSQSQGGGVFIAAGSSSPGTDDLVEIVNSTIAKNTANIGGGIAFGDGTGEGNSIAATTIRHSTITENTAGESGLNPGRSNGGGISLGSFLADVIRVGPTEGRDTFYDGGLFLDHTIVAGNFHVNNLNIAFDYGPAFDALAVAAAQSPDIGMTQAYRNYDVATGQLYDGEFGAPYTTLGISFSNLGTFGSSLLADSLSLSEPELTPGTLTQRSSAEHGIYYEPGGAYVDSGNPAYTPNDLPIYILPEAVAAVGTDEVRFDQRSTGFQRVVGPRIDIGSIESEGTDTTAPRVTNVVVDGVQSSGLPWAESARVDFSQRVAANNEQLKPVFTQGANRIEVTFDEPVLAAQDDLVLKYSYVLQPGDPGYTEPGETVTLELLPNAVDLNAGPNTVAWTFDTPLENSKYAIHLDADQADGVTDLAGNPLDGEWHNADMMTPDTFSDDANDGRWQTQQANLPIGEFGIYSGDGNPGSTDTDADSDTEFRFHFSILAGDYNGDGSVSVSDFFSSGDGDGNGVNGDPADQQLVGDSGGAALPLSIFAFEAFAPWADFSDDDIIDAHDLATVIANTGLRRAQPEDGDADGNGRVEAKDLEIWRSQFGSQGSQFSADFDSDWDVDIADLFIFARNFGLRPADRSDGDADGDLDVDEDDRLVVERLFGDLSVWYVASDQQALTALMAGMSPQVTNVTVSGSVSTHAPFSFDTVDGSGTQLATVPVGGADTVSVTFSDDVMVAAADLLMIGLTTANVPAVDQFSYDPVTFTATWQLTGLALADQYILTVSDNVTNAAGYRLDGDWTNPASFATTDPSVSNFDNGSGDGLPGGNFNFVMTLLPGDANLDGIVDMTDWAIFEPNLGSSGLFFTDGDFSGDGLATLFDDGFTLTANMGIDLRDVTILGDLDGDFDVDEDDIEAIALAFGMASPTLADGDLDGDGDVDIDDLDLALAQFGIELNLVA